MRKYSNKIHIFLIYAVYLIKPNILRTNNAVYFVKEDH